MIPILSDLPAVAGIPPEIAWPIAAVVAVGGTHLVTEFGDAMQSVSMRSHPILWKLMGRGENPTPILDEFCRKNGIKLEL